MKTKPLIALRRCFELICTAVLLLLALPVCVCLYALLLSKSAQPFFQQERMGLKAQSFTMYKFRTMDDRTGAVTRIGSWLRKYSLDELPQLFNVLLGQMSLIGPRPLPVTYRPYFERFHARRHDVRPGITGWAQVSGRNALPWEKQFELDTWYIDHRSPGLDARILWLTALKWLRPSSHETAQRAPLM